MLQCKVNNGKYLALCAAATLDGKILDLQYRFGRADKIELMYPALLPSSLALFNMSHYFRHGTDYSIVEFSNDEYDYGIYRYESLLGELNVKLGVSVLNRVTGKEVNIACRSTIKDEFWRLKGRLACNTESALGCAP